MPQVRFWRRGKLEAYARSGDGNGYDPLAADRSRLLPDLDLRLLERCVIIRQWREAKRAFRAGLTASK